MMLATGTRLGPYEIVSFIGAGGMGEVYKARDTRLDRHVAIKVAAERFTDRFSREAHAIAALSDSHICTLFDVGPNYLVMEYIEGETLAQRLKKGALPLQQVLRVGFEAAQALAAAHRRGIIHRDLKPANIMLTESGTKLLDFGLAAIEPAQAADVQTSTVVTGPAAVVGTLPYMSPEQLEAKKADARSDIFALGAVLYEMATGKSAFARDSPLATIKAVSSEEPIPVTQVAKGMPRDLEHIVRRCLRKNRDDRYSSASDVAAELEQCLAFAEPSGKAFKVLLRQARRPLVAIPGLILALALFALVGWSVQRSRNAQWARTQALPEIARLTEQEKRGQAYALALKAEKYIPGDPTLAKLWPQISFQFTAHTVPAGASVFRRDYGSRGNWELVSRSPINKQILPRIDSQWRFELKGFLPVERLTLLLFGRIFPSDSFLLEMDNSGQAPLGMVHQTDSVDGPLTTEPATLFGLPGFEAVPAIQIQDYWIDRYEVTNQQFKVFMDKGGYRERRYWKHDFRKDGRTLSWAEAIALFRDATGRTGPATWELGTFPPGREDYPVSGVSWYEAAAYAEFAGKKLPTIYHWAVAASPWASNVIIPAGNFGGLPLRVGASGSMSWFGAYDMAGNVKEWCWNEAASGKRFIMGGGYDEPYYMFNDADARSPFERSANFGFRCAMYTSAGQSARAADPIVLSERDFNREKPVPGSVFQLYKSLYTYDKTPLNPTIGPIEETDDWRREEITFAAAYGNERVIAYLYLPKQPHPPLQTVVFFPGSSAIDMRSSATGPGMPRFDFIVKSGRALLAPVYKGTFERGDDLKSDIPNTSSSWRDHVIAWSKDLGRSIDYLETRPEIDRTKLAYLGSSWGGSMGSVLPAVEPRIKVCVLVVPGFNLQRSLPEVDELNFAPRVNVPVLMLNGRFDFFYPVETSQEPMFRFLGSPKEHKRRVVYNTSHNIPNNELIKETLDWLDKYLGPVM
jgi:serine/threonine protein kinase/cephalosporin-C deacetylase-like acetyl esterase